MLIKVSANQFAEFVATKSPARRKQIVRQTKYGTSHPTFYSCFNKPAAKFLVSGARDATPLLAEIDKMQDRAKVHANSQWYQTDCRNTAVAFRALIKAAPEFYSMPVTFNRPGAGSKTRLRYGNVEISVPPNLIIHGERNGKPLIGALRFYLAKESTYRLGPQAAEIVASLEYEWLTQLATGTRTPDTSLCLVFECFQGRITSAPSNVHAQHELIERGCAAFEDLWTIIDDKSAA